MGKIAIIGGFGSIGKRYVSICNYLGIQWVIYDVSSGINREEVNRFLDRTNPEKALICSPTDTHIGYCQIMVDRELPFMCEKPLSKDLFDAARIAKLVELKNMDAFVVNNYQFVLNRMRSQFNHGLNRTFDEYSYYNTGKDGILFDCCQLVYINPEITINIDSPVWILRYGDKNVSYRDVEISYISMIEAWDNGEHDKLWTMDDGAAMTETVLDRIIRESKFIPDDVKGLQ